MIYLKSRSQEIEVPEATPFANDKLDRFGLCNILTDVVSFYGQSGCVMGLDGEWGSGKTTFVRMWRQHLENNGYKTLYFNAWASDYTEDPLMALVSELSGLSPEDDTVNKIATGAARIGLSVFKGILKKAIGVDCDAIHNAIDETFVLGKEYLEKYSEQKTTLDELKKNIQSFVADNAGEYPVIFFVDELDRCNPETILDTLEAMRLFLFNGKVAFVIGADERHVTYAIKTKFNDIEGINMDIGKEYQEKLIQYPIRIPSMNEDETEFYVMCLLSENEISDTEFDGVLKYLQDKRKETPLDFRITMGMLKEHDDAIATKLNESLILSKQLSGILTQGLNGNPRQCKRFLNTLDMRQKMASYKNVELRNDVLAKIMEVEYFEPALFRKMVKLLSDNLLVQEIKAFENDEEDKIVALEPWKNELWVQRWMKAKPKLAEEELGKYFYFMRSSDKDKGLVNVQRMSDVAQRIFEGLVGHSELVFRQAEKEVEKLSVADQNFILDGLFEELIVDKVLDNDKLDFFLRWGSLNEQLQENTVKYLEDIGGERLTVSVIPLVEGFYTGLQNKSKLHSILERWSSENASIATEIQSFDK